MFKRAVKLHNSVTRALFIYWRSFNLDNELSYIILHENKQIMNYLHSFIRKRVNIT